MTEGRDPEPQHQTTHQDAPETCCCGSSEHAGIRIGDRLSPSGGIIAPVYVCPAESATGLQGAL
ncbi:hypothetical protein [Streptomyces cadmiisoli]|uniref:hypothetical protein n=1 Tax=Streptomyces cadmiisoli TaxID=2184053 RepID=UPI00365B0291